MKDIVIDTETSVVWPSWYYSDDIYRSNIEKDSRISKADIVAFQNIIAASNKNRSTGKSPQLSDDEDDNNKGCHNNTKYRSSQAVDKKMLSERSLLLSGYSNNTIDSITKNCEQNKTPLSVAQASALAVTPTATAAAAAYLYFEKVKNERMSPRVTAAETDSLNDVITESSSAAAAAAMINNNNNNCNSISNNNNGSSENSSSNQSTNNSILSQNQLGKSLNNISEEMNSHSHSPVIGQQQHQPTSLSISSNHVKRERLSPIGTNGDVHSALSRSRSTTPSSFRGTPPQLSLHNSPSETVTPMHNLSTNILNSIQQAAASSSARHNSLSYTANSNAGLPSDFSTRNYSDFMRSLAAKYNNPNNNDFISTSAKRETFFDASTNSTTKKTNTAQKATYLPSNSASSICKEVSITATTSLPPPPPIAASGTISPGESALSQPTQSQMAAAAASQAAVGGNVSPFMTSLLSSLPFASSIFPPLIDMSSTQALITLARAAKETQIHNILHVAQNIKQNAAKASPSPSPSLNMALQQAAQFISPALVYSVQMQKQVSTQSSPRSTNITSSTASTLDAASSKDAGEKRNASPLDLSSQQPNSKRFKSESKSKQKCADDLSDVTIKRRTSTVTRTPSPAPENEKPSSPAGLETTTAAFTTGNGKSAYSLNSSSIRQCQAHSEEVNSWTVQDVCDFVGSIDICAEYVKHFREQCIDGSGLPLLTEDHLVNSLGMKLGPALKLRSKLANKLGGPCPCVACVAQAQHILALQTGAGINAATGNIALNVNTATFAADNCNSHVSKSATAITNNGPTSSASNSHCNNNNDSKTSTMLTDSTSAKSNEDRPAATAAGNVSSVAILPAAFSNCNSNDNSSIKSSASNLDEDEDGFTIIS